MTQSDQPDTRWSDGIIESTDGRLYTGITTDMARRWQDHTQGRNGAKFFRGRKPARLRFLEAEDNRSSASKREAAIKKLTRPNKLTLITTQAEQDWHRILDL